MIFQEDHLHLHRNQLNSFTMATISNKTQEIQARFVQAGFTPEEIQAVRDAWNHGLWGDSEVEFAGQDEYGIGACTNDIKLAGNFQGRQVTNICRKIANRIKKQGLDWINHFNDWWGDGSGDMLFIACKVGSWEELAEWAATSADSYVAEPEQEKPVEEAPKAESVSELDNKAVLNAVERIKKYTIELNSGKADKKREASLKRKIARAEAALLKAGAVYRLFNDELGCWGDGTTVYTSAREAMMASGAKCRHHSVWVVVGDHNSVQVAEVDWAWFFPVKE